MLVSSAKANAEPEESRPGRQITIRRGMAAHRIARDFTSAIKQTF
ncbi:MAG TPA: hypothetical protein VIF82_18275 [Burkholderiaceae bacterium]